MSKEYHKGEIGQMVGFLAQEYGFDLHEAAAKMKAYFPALRDKTKCGNCGASMLIYEHAIDMIDAGLLVAMGEEVRWKVDSGTPFTQANAVYVQGLALSYSATSRTTWCSKMGLVAKIPKKARTGKENWLITARGFAFLRNEEVPKRVAVWRNEIQDRFPERTTISEILGDVYVPSEWYNAGRIIQGNLL